MKHMEIYDILEQIKPCCLDVTSELFEHTCEIIA